MLQQIVALMGNKMFWVGLGAGLFLLIGYYIFAAWVGSLDVPTDQHSVEYRRWKFYNLLAANLKRAAKAGHIPVADTVCMGAEELEQLKAKGVAGDNS